MGRGGFQAAQQDPYELARIAAETKKKEEDAFKQLQSQQRAGVRIFQPTKQEKEAGVEVPFFEGIRDRETGELLSQFKFDPYQGEATQKLKEQAMSEGMSPWALMQMEKQKQEQMAGMDQAARQGLGALSQAQASLASAGGLSSGARTSLARQAMRDSIMAKQGVARQGISSRLGIQGQDIDRRQGLLQDFANAEKGAQQFNLNQTTGDIDRLNQAMQGRYQTGMQAYGAQKSAEAQRAAAEASKPKSGCCFIFLEARYGDGTLDSVVRRYRDEFMTDRNKRGYYKLSEVLVPLMRKSKLVKSMVRVFMTDPLVSYGKWYYGQGKMGVLFSPLKHFWLKTFDLLGEDTEFVRESGEVV